MPNDNKRRFAEKKAKFFTWLAELIRYGLVGGVTTVINLLLFFILQWLNLYYIIANIISYFVAVCLNYFLNYKLVFIHEKNVPGNNKRGFQKFIVVRLVSLILDNCLLYLFVTICGLPLAASRIGLTFAGIMVTYVIVKKIVF